MSETRFAVMERCDEFEQLLMLRVDSSTPKLGILAWRGKGDFAAVFCTRKAARAAIERTEHYRKAFGRSDLPEARYCKVVGVKTVPL